jgi:hypothetical protein
MVKMTFKVKINPNLAGANLDGRPPLPSYVEAISWYYPSLKVYSYGDEYSDIVWPNSYEKVSKPALDNIRLQYAKYLYIERSFEQANKVQEAATGYHTVSKTTTQIQTDVYRMKYDDALAYVTSYEAAENKDNVEVPQLLVNESQLVGQNPYELALGIIKNFNGSDLSLRSYFGTIEGIRRLLKKRILEVDSLSALESMPWVTWPNYVPSTEVDLEA